jgi:hypothetical protein
MSAIAEGALAVGITANRGDWSIGYSRDWINAAAAHREALRRCRDGSEKEVADLCSVISDFHRECVAIAKVETGDGFGWGIDRDLENAEQQALEMCKSIAGPDRAGSCKVKYESRSNACDKQDRGR